MADTTGADLGDAADVLAVVHEFDEALDRGDFEAAGRLCLDDFVFLGSGEGEESRGPAGLGEMLSTLHARVGAALVRWNLELDPYEVAVRGDSALVTASGQFELVMRDAARSGRYLMVGVLHRTPEGWRWWAYHGSEPQPW